LLRCWLNGTFYVKEINGTLLDFEYERHLNYYQWMVFIIIFKIMLFRLPSVIWSFFISLNGFDLSHVTKIVMNKVYLDEYLESKNWAKTKFTIEAIGDHLRMSFLKQKFQANNKKLFNIFKEKRSIVHAKKDEIKDPKALILHRLNSPNLKTKSSFPLFQPFLLVKLVYLANLGFNFIFLTKIFGFDYFTYGPNFVYLLATGKYQFMNEYFPKRGVCYTKIVSKDHENVITSICSLPINLINEYFYAAYWYL
jgi:hypothetical protein